MGLFDTILGPDALGLTGSEQESRTRVSLDPTTRALNDFRFQSLPDPLALQRYLDNFTATGNVSNQTQQLLDRATTAAFQRGFDPQEFLTRATQNLGYAPQSEDFLRNTGQLQSQLSNFYDTARGNQSGLYTASANAVNDAYNNLQGTQAQYYNNAGNILGSYFGNAQQGLQGQYNNLQGNVNDFYNANRGTLAQGYNTAGNISGNYYQNVGQQLAGFQDPTFGRSQFGRIDPYSFTSNAYSPQQRFDPNLSTAGIENQLLKAGGDYYSQILGPQVSSQNALLGLARSGAAQEAQGRAAASISLPIAQQVADIRNQIQQQGNTIGTQQTLQGNDIRNSQEQLLQNLGFQNIQQLNQFKLAQEQGLNQLNLSQEQQINAQRNALLQQQRGLIGANLSQGGSAQDALLQAGLQSQYGLAQNQGQSLANIGLASNDALRQLYAQSGQAQQDILGQGGQALTNTGLAQNNAYQQILSQNAASQQDFYSQLGQFSGNAGLANLNYQGGLGTQYLQNLYGLNQQYPTTAINAQNAELARYSQGVGFSDYARNVRSGVNQQALGGYLSAFNAIPYTPAVSTSTTGQGNEGILTSYLGSAGSGAGVGAALAL